MSKTLGRLPAALVGKPVTYDAPERTVSAILTNQDSVIAAIQAMCVALDAASVAGSFVSNIGSKLQLIDLTE